MDYKKMIAMAGALACVSAFAVESANVVGYQNKENREGFNYFAPTFIKIDGTKKVNLQDIQMGPEVSSSMAEIQILGANQVTTDTYIWYKNRTDGKVGPSSARIDAPKSNGAWFLYNEDEDEYTYVDDLEFDYGDCVQLTAEDGVNSVVSGAVTDDDVLFAGASATREGFNYYGNPYPSAIDINDVQMSEDVASSMAEIQILGANQVTTDTYIWYKNRSDGKVGPSSARVPAIEGTNGAWFLYNEDEDEYSFADRTFESGEGFQLTAEEGVELTILAPYEL